MAELTKQDIELLFSEQLKHMPSKADLAAAVAPLATQQFVNDAIKPLATRAFVEATIKPLATKKDLTDAVDDLARMVATSVVEPMEQRFDKLEHLVSLKLRVDNLEQVLEHNLTKLEAKLNIELEHAS